MTVTDHVTVFAVSLRAEPAAVLTVDGRQREGIDSSTTHDLASLT